MSQAKKKRVERRRSRPKQKRTGTWWIAGIAMRMQDGHVAIMPPVLGLAYDDQDRAMVRAMLAAIPWSELLGPEYEKSLETLRLQCLPIATKDVARMQEDLERQRDHHPEGKARQAARIALGQSEAAERVPIPQYVRELKSARHAGCKPAEMVRMD